MSEKTLSRNRWWGVSRLSEGEVHHWRIGPADLWVQHLAGEWRLAMCRGEDVLDTSLESERLPGVPDVGEFGEVSRFAVSGKSATLTLAPLLADRPIINRPQQPFTVPAGEQVKVHVSTPLWIRVSAGEPPDLLQEVPILRPSDTWFGPNTREGEVCYASSTRFVMRLENAPMVPHRATTALHIRNEAAEPLSLDRIRLPVVNLAVFQGVDGRIWTNDVTLERKEADEFAELHVGERGPAGVGTTTLVAEPREPEAGNVVVRAFSKLLQVW